jgi:CarD family transcriptional regulator
VGVVKVRTTMAQTKTKMMTKKTDKTAAATKPTTKPLAAKPAPTKAAAVKPAASKPTSSAKPAVKPATKSATIAKSIAGASAAIKKPSPQVKQAPAKAVAKAQPATAVKPAGAKPDMAAAPKKADGAKPSPARPVPVATKPALAKPAVVPAKPPVAVAPVKPAAPAAVAPAAAPAAPALTRPPLPMGSRPSSPFNRPPLPGQKPFMNGRPIVHGPIVAPPQSTPPTGDGPRKPVTTRHGFKIGETIVYPAHGVGKIIAIDEQEIANISLELFVIQFEKDKMILRVPTGKAEQVGMRKLAEDGIVSRAMETLKGRARIKRTMWSRRAQEFEAKINSGNLVAIAEVVRDLYRAENQPEQSYSERQLYEAALDRMARELAAVEKLDERGAAQRIVDVLSKSAKGRKAASDAAAASADGSGDSDEEDGDATQAA